VRCQHNVLVCPSVRHNVRLSVRPSVRPCGANIIYFSKESTYLWFIYSRRCGVVCPTELGLLHFFKGYGISSFRTVTKTVTGGRSSEGPCSSTESEPSFGWSELRYVQINIEGLPGKVTSLNDSGCQLCVARRDVLKSLNLPKLGEAKLKGLSKEVIPADLVRVRMKLADGSAFSNVTCAVVDNLNHSVILGSDIVEKLNVKLAEEQCCINDVIDVDVINIDNNVIDGDVMSDVTNADNGDDDNDVSVDPRKASADILRTEQKTDRSLAGCWSLAERQKAGYFVRDGILYRQQEMLGHEYEQLVLPAGRRAEVIKLGHEVVGGHLASKKAKERIKLSFTWPTIAKDVQRACETCHLCQKRRRVTVYDRVPINPIPRNEVAFDCLVMDCLGPLFPSQKLEYNYALVLCDSNTRYPFAYPLRSLSAKNVCNAFLGSTLTSLSSSPLSALVTSLITSPKVETGS